MSRAFVFSLPQPTLPIAGGGLFPVRRVWCIGRNYPAHAREMGGDPAREPPFFFAKPGDGVQPVAPGQEATEHPMPPLTTDYQPEVELVVGLAGGGRNIPAADALAHVFGYAVGLDMTRRDVQASLKDARRPWEAGKAFDHCAPVGPIVPASRCGHLSAGAITLDVNGIERQRGNLADMVWNVAALLAELSRWSALAAGDLVMTGTPAGVGAVQLGDELLARIDGLPELRLRIVPESVRRA